MAHSPTTLRLVSLVWSLAAAASAAELPLIKPPVIPLEAFETLPPTLPGLDVEGSELDAPETELITERYPNRAARIQRTVKQDAERNYVNHGPWTMWDPQGRVIAQGEYQEGRRHGEWTRKLPHFPGVGPEFQPPFLSQAAFDAGELHGSWTVVDSQQRIVGSWTFEQGVLHGSATIWYPGGQQKQEMQFDRGIPHGPATAWKPDGSVWAREYYRQGKQLVPTVSWYDRQQKETEGWLVRSDSRIEVHVDWWEGTVEFTRQASAGEDVRTGKWTEWHANGNVRYEGTFDHGTPVGQHTWWHENGQRMLSGYYDSGDRDGRWTSWHANGHKQEEGLYVDGLKDGVWTAWSESGDVTQVQQLTAHDGDRSPPESAAFTSITAD